MPLGLTMGGSTPSPCGSQSVLELSVSYKRTNASVRGTPTLYCTVITATPGLDTDMTCSVACWAMQLPVNSSPCAVWMTWQPRKVAESSPSGLELAK